MKIFSTEESESIAIDICKQFKIPLSTIDKEKYSDGEFSVALGETVRGSKVFIVGSTHQSDNNDNLMELLMLIRSAKDANASDVIVINPYYGFARQDRKVRDRTCITAKLVADLIKSAGATSIVTVDIHARQIQGFFDFPSDNIDGYRILLPYLRNTLTENTIICSPDQGGYVRASIFSKELGNLSMVAINKKREKPNQIASMELLGDVTGKDVVIIDDMIDTAGTLCKAVAYLMEEGANSVRAIITHPVLSGNAYDNLNSSMLSELILSDTIPKANSIKEQLSNIKVTVISCAMELANVINSINKNESITHNI